MAGKKTNGSRAWVGVDMCSDRGGAESDRGER